jgi:hypothetical protein
LVGNLAAETSVTFEDDGVTQRVTAKTGVARIANVGVPRIVSLRPYRTFQDLDQQPEGKFLLRIRKEGNSPTIALFAADGQMWGNKAIGLCKSYLEAGIKPDRAVII